MGSLVLISCVPCFFFSGPSALILVPTRELAKQCLQEVKKLSKGLHLTTTLIEKEETVAKKCKVQMVIR